MKQHTGWAIVPIGSTGLCFTSDPWDKPIWQIYKTEQEAQGFLGIPFSDAQYMVVKVAIVEMPTCQEVT